MQRRGRDRGGIRDRGRRDPGRVTGVLLGEGDGAEANRRQSNRLARSPRVVGVWPRPLIPTGLLAGVWGEASWLT